MGRVRGQDEAREGHRRKDADPDILPSSAIPPLLVSESRRQLFDFSGAMCVFSVESVFGVCVGVKDG